MGRCGPRSNLTRNRRTFYDVQNFLVNWSTLAKVILLTNQTDKQTDIARITSDMCENASLLNKTLLMCPYSLMNPFAVVTTVQQCQGPELRSFNFGKCPAWFVQKEVEKGRTQQQETLKPPTQPHQKTH